MNDDYLLSESVEVCPLFFMVSSTHGLRAQQLAKERNLQNFSNAKVVSASETSLFQFVPRFLRSGADSSPC